MGRVNLETAEGFVPRAICPQCRRPEVVCYCKHISTLETKTRVVLLQHPRERDMAIGTARMASLCLPNSELHVGVRWGGSSELARALSDPDRPAALLYPGKGAIDVVKHPPEKPITLIVIDGTWAQTKTVVRQNPELAKLPRYAFSPPTPSEYRIRKEPDDAYVSTIEALMHVLGALENDPEKFQALLTPFRAMIDAQIECESRFQKTRSRHPKKAKKSPPRAPAPYRERAKDLVCVVGEANAWPYRTVERDHQYPDELIHWVAKRVSTGEIFDFTVAPKNPISPRTVEYVGLSEDLLRQSGSLSDLFVAWNKFVRGDDVICSWGRYATKLFVASGGTLPALRFDLRMMARILTKTKVGTLEQFVKGIHPEAVTPAARGRAGTRVEHNVAVANHLLHAGEVASPPASEQ